jgi:hypothetical protein
MNECDRENQRTLTIDTTFAKMVPVWYTNYAYGRVEMRL